MLYKVELIQMRKIKNLLKGRRQSFKPTGNTSMLPRTFASYNAAADAGKIAIRNTSRRAEWKSDGITWRWVVLTIDSE